MSIVALKNINTAQRPNIAPGHENTAISSCQPGDRVRTGCPSSAHVLSLCAPAHQLARGVGGEPCLLSNPEVPKHREQETGRQGPDCSVSVASAPRQALVATVSQEPAKGCCLGSWAVCGAGTPRGWGKWFCVSALESIIDGGYRARGWIPQGPGCA